MKRKITILMMALLLGGCVSEGQSLRPTADRLAALRGKTLAVVDVSRLKLNYVDAASTWGRGLGGIAGHALESEGAKIEAQVESEFHEINKMPTKLVRRVEDYLLSEYAMTRIDEKIVMEVDYVFSDEIDESEDADYGTFVTYLSSADYVLAFSAGWMLFDFPNNLLFRGEMKVVDAKTQTVISSVRCFYDERKDGSGRKDEVLRSNGGELIMAITNAIEDRCVKRVIENMNSPLG